MKSGIFPLKRLPLILLHSAKIYNLGTSIFPSSFNWSDKSLGEKKNMYTTERTYKSFKLLRLPRLVGNSPENSLEETRLLLQEKKKKKQKSLNYRNCGQL